MHKYPGQESGSIMPSWLHASASVEYFLIWARHRAKLWGYKDLKTSGCLQGAYNVLAEKRSVTEWHKRALYRGMMRAQTGSISTRGAGPGEISWGQGPMWLGRGVRVSKAPTHTLGAGRGGSRGWPEHENLQVAMGLQGNFSLPQCPRLWRGAGNCLKLKEVRITRDDAERGTR